MTTSDTLIIVDGSSGVYGPKFFIERLEQYLSDDYREEYKNELDTVKKGPYSDIQEDVAQKDSFEYDEKDDAYFEAWNTVFDTMEIIFEDKKYYPYVSDEGDIWLVLSSMLFNEETGWFEHPGDNS